MMMMMMSGAVLRCCPWRCSARLCCCGRLCCRLSLHWRLNTECWQWRRNVVVLATLYVTDFTDHWNPLHSLECVVRKITTVRSEAIRNDLRRLAVVVGALLLLMMLLLLLGSLPRGCVVHAPIAAD